MPAHIDLIAPGDFASLGDAHVLEEAPIESGGEDALSWEVEGEFDLPDGLQWIELGSESVQVVARPVYVLFGVDIGWSSRP